MSDYVPDPRAIEFAVACRRATKALAAFFAAYQEGVDRELARMKAARVARRAREARNHAAFMKAVDAIEAP